jgi:rfaE bifunctional protein kinase chain/domain
MLTDDALERILDGIPSLSVAVVGDLFLDRYLDLDATLTEPSVETGLDAFQVVRVRAFPGAAGTVINNLVALGVGAVQVIAVIGDDGEGYELRQALRRMAAVRTVGLFAHPDRRTPTYIKPMLASAAGRPRELNRLDIKNRVRLTAEAEGEVLRALVTHWPEANALIVVDQVSERDCGVITTAVRQRLADLGGAEPGKVVLADSRDRIGVFANLHLKPNEKECLKAVGHPADVTDAATELARRCGRFVFCTRGDQGILVADPGDQAPVALPAFAVRGAIDPVGAGDSTSAAIACALACGESPPVAAAFGNLVASITIQQLGTTGTASPDQIRRRWRDIETT